VVAVAAVLALLALGLGGVALLLAAALPTAQMPAAWVLVALPAGWAPSPGPGAVAAQRSRPDGVRCGALA
jgi:hypothetical protein